MMLITTLHYFPDASTDASVEFGSLIFFLHDSKKSRMAWYEPVPGVVFAAQSATDAPWVRRILKNFQSFVDGIIEELPEFESVEQFARDLLTSLPCNFRHGRVTPYPDQDFVLRLAEHLELSVHQRHAPATIVEAVPA